MLKNISLFILNKLFNFSSMILLSHNYLFFSIFNSCFFCSMYSLPIYSLSYCFFTSRRRTRKTRETKTTSSKISKITSKTWFKAKSSSKTIISEKFCERVFTSEKIFENIISIKWTEIKREITTSIILSPFIFTRKDWICFVYFFDFSIISS